MTQANSASPPLVVETLDDGALRRFVLGGSKGNILDQRSMTALTEAFQAARQSADLRAILLTAQGPHFSFGASVPEHVGDQVAGMLARFHELLTALLACELPVVAAVRGQCLGGGLELVTLCHRIYAAADARLGQPEIALGVLAPAASVALVERVGRGVAEDLCLSGRSLTAAEAAAAGLVDEVAEDPEAAALAFARAHFAGKSASSLRLAVRAVRVGFVERFERELHQIERLYLEELMATADAHEGLAAFLERRSPRWRHR